MTLAEEVSDLLAKKDPDRAVLCHERMRVPKTQATVLNSTAGAFQFALLASAKH